MKTAQDLLDIPDDECVQEMLDSIPDYVTDVLHVNPSTILEAVCKLHGMHAHWATRLAAARGRQLATKSAKEVGLAVARRDKRAELITRYGKTTDRIVETQAYATVAYVELCEAEAKAEMAYLQCKGIVDAIMTKREALRMLSYVLRDDMDLANSHVSTPSYSDNSLMEIAKKPFKTVAKGIGKNMTGPVRKVIRRRAQ